MDSTRFNSRVRPYEDLVLPIVWIEIGVERLTPGLIVLLQMLFDILPYVQAGCVFLLCIFGVSMFAAAALSYFWISSHPKEKEMNTIYGKCEFNDEFSSQLNDKPTKSDCFSFTRFVSWLKKQAFCAFVHFRKGIQMLINWFSLYFSKKTSYWFPHISRDRCPEGSNDLMLKQDIV